jgi:hypothetical protein
VFLYDELRGGHAQHKVWLGSTFACRAERQVLVLAYRSARQTPLGSWPVIREDGLYSKKRSPMSASGD